MRWYQEYLLVFLIGRDNHIQTSPFILSFSPCDSFLLSLSLFWDSCNFLLNIHWFPRVNFAGKVLWFALDPHKEGERCCLHLPREGILTTDEETQPFTAALISFQSTSVGLSWLLLRGCSSHITPYAMFPSRCSNSYCITLSKVSFFANFKLSSWHLSSFGPSHGGPCSHLFLKLTVLCSIMTSLVSSY